MSNDIVSIPLTVHFVKEFGDNVSLDDVWSTCNWNTRDAVINSGKKVVFEQGSVEFPDFWSDQAVNIVASKYFAGKIGTEKRESSLKHIISRVVNAIAEWAITYKYYNEKEANMFKCELAYILLHQMASFNSPVWFNVGRLKNPQCSACFIQSVEDSLDSIFSLSKNEVMLFKHGSGTGSNLSNIRSNGEPLSYSGGEATGPVSFMKGLDMFASVVKSGGVARKAAKMVILNVSHPDIRDFIWCKAVEEKKAKILIENGYDANFNSSFKNSVYDKILFQNANNSVRLSDSFMEALEKGLNWETKRITDNKTAWTAKAEDLFNEIAQAAWECGDPGVQFDDIINEWHTCKASGRINGSNPCSEYMFLDDTACNLSSINLVKFFGDDISGENNLLNNSLVSFTAAVETMITAMEILVSGSSYPTKPITENSRKYRPLGIGYSNLGTVIMLQGFEYGSEMSVYLTGAITSLMSSVAYHRSGEIAKVMGAFEGINDSDGKHDNKYYMTEVIKKHSEKADKLNDHIMSRIRDSHNLVHISSLAFEVWKKTLRFSESGHFWRNSQISVLAPTGTISFMMDCDTTGIEPELSINKTKRLVDGGIITIENQTIKKALIRMGYKESQADDAVEFAKKHGSVRKWLSERGHDEKHMRVFLTSFPDPWDGASIDYSSHLTIMAAAQPFLSGAISKTVNLSESVTVNTIKEVYLKAYDLGIKAVAVYRDNCKGLQPLSTKAVTKDAKDTNVVDINHNNDHAKFIELRDKFNNRRRLPKTRSSVTHKFEIGGNEGYITCGEYEDGTLGEIFINVSKSGSTISGIMNTLATTFSMAIQHGVPIKSLLAKWAHTKFEPHGMTGYADIPFAKSIIDYIAKFLSYRYLPMEDIIEIGIMSPKMYEEYNKNANTIPVLKAVGDIANIEFEKPLNYDTHGSTSCGNCGSFRVVPNGACMVCQDCGSTTGCG